MMVSYGSSIYQYKQILQQQTALSAAAVQATEPAKQHPVT